MLHDVDSIKTMNELSFGLEETTYSVNCAVKSSAVPKVTQSRNFNCTNLQIFQHALDLTAQLLTVQVKLNVYGGALPLLTAELTAEISYAKRTHQQRTVPANITKPSPLIEIHLVEEIIRTNSSEPAEKSSRVREALISDEVSH